MESFADNGMSLPVLFIYGLLILLYLMILRLLLNLLQQLSDKHSSQRSVIDRDIHSAMIDHAETSMHTFDVYSMAIIVAKGGIAAVAMAAAVVLLVVKAGLIATAILIAIAVLLLWTYHRWVLSHEKAKTIRSEIQKYAHKAGGIGVILLLSICLAVLLFVMIWL